MKIRSFIDSKLSEYEPAHAWVGCDEEKIELNLQIRSNNVEIHFVQMTAQEAMELIRELQTAVGVILHKLETEDKKRQAEELNQSIKISS